MIRLLQLLSPTGRRLAFVEEPHLRLFESIHTTYDLVNTPLGNHRSIADLIEDALGDQRLDYDAIYAGKSDWKILPPLDHPEPARCIISGTGLTHLGSAKNRDAMHEKSAATQAPETDSMKMFRWGVEKGRPPRGEPGIAPEWFYKGTGDMLRGHGQPLEIPPHGEDGGEEAEIVGLYIIADDGNGEGGGTPIRVGMAQGNEFSDHIFEKKNYLNLAGSKLRTCSVGPELVLRPDFSVVSGEVSILRKGQSLWTKKIATGENEMCHSLANIEHHHFKFDGHRRPGDVHIHFFGACALSFGEGVLLQDGDLMQVHFEHFGRPLVNPLRAPSSRQPLVTVHPLA